MKKAKNLKEQKEENSYKKNFNPSEKTSFFLYFEVFFFVFIT